MIILYAVTVSSFALCMLLVWPEDYPERTKTCLLRRNTIKEEKFVDVGIRF
jgi:hypothetical protein